MYYSLSVASIDTRGHRKLFKVAGLFTPCAHYTAHQAGLIRVNLYPVNVMTRGVDRNLNNYPWKTWGRELLRPLTV